MGLKKIHVKILEGKSIRWVHFCYALEEVKAQFDRYVNVYNLSSNQWVFKWACQDFGDMKLSTSKDIEKLRERIKAKYKELYPDIYMDSSCDNQGWIRAWYTEHMRKELEKVGK